MSLHMLSSAGAQATPAQPGYGPQTGAAAPRVPQRPQSPAPRAAQSQPGQSQQQAQQAGQQPPLVKLAPQPRAVPRAPWQLTAEQQQRLNLILDHWEKVSGQVKTYSCRFRRWRYDTFVKEHAHLISDGVIRYAAPDKGEFRVERIQRFSAPKEPGGKPEYVAVEEPIEEHWICDGQAVFELNAKLKQLIERKLPPDMQGKQIADGPLPFMFGADKEKLFRRYWIREVPPKQGRTDEYWLEILPKYAEDAANFQRVLIILDREKFLPVAMNVFPPENSQQNPTREAYQFYDRFDNDLRHRTEQFFGGFIAPKVPRGWEKVVENFGQIPANAAVGQRPSADRAARKP